MAELIVYGRNDDPVEVEPSPGGDTFKNSALADIGVFNPTAENRQITVIATQRCDHGFLDHRVQTIRAGKLDFVRGIEAARHNDAQAMASITFDDVSNLLVFVQRVLT